MSTRCNVDGERIRVIGTNQLIAPVCAAVLGDDHLGPPDLRVHHPDLEDALIALISDTSLPRRPLRCDRCRSAGRSVVMRSLLRLAVSELKLFVREPMVLTFVFAFPVLTVLILGGVFDDDDPNFEGALPSDYYVAAYIGVVIAAIGLVMLPVHLASYRERGVLRRFDVSRYPRWALPAAWILVAMVITAVAVTVLLVTGHLVYGLPAPDNLLAVAVGTLLGAFTFISIGIALGLAMPSARSAQGLGMLLFFPFFLLGGAGPPPDAMGDPMSTIANAVPLTHVVRSIQEPWLDLGTPTGHLAVLAALAVVATIGWITLSTRAARMTRPQPPAGDDEMVTPTAPPPEPEPQDLRAEAQRWVRRLRDPLHDPRDLRRAQSHVVRHRHGRRHRKPVVLLADARHRACRRRHGHRPGRHRRTVRSRLGEQKGRALPPPAPRQERHRVSWRRPHHRRTAPTRTTARRPDHEDRHRRRVRRRPGPCP